MNTVEIKLPLLLLSILSLIIAQNGVHTIDNSDNDELNSSKTEDSERGDENGNSEERQGNRPADVNKIGRHTSFWGNRIRQKRSLASRDDNILHIEPVTDLTDDMTNIYSDSEYVSGLLAANYRPRRYFDSGHLLEDKMKNKRINTDYGYGSRLQAAENLAMDWDRNGLFGVMGPGKRSYNDIFLESVKRVPTDFGYGSRNRAAEIAAMSSNSGLYGLYGPGKRSNFGLAMTEENPEYEIGKRFIDYGYGSRMQAAENVAHSASKGGLFGNHGPGKRNSNGLFFDLQSKYPVLERLQKRITSDFGYGSREQAAENIAKLKAKGTIFGVYGPGKRSI